MPSICSSPMFSVTGRRPMAIMIQSLSTSVRRFRLGHDHVPNPGLGPLQGPGRWSSRRGWSSPLAEQATQLLADVGVLERTMRSMNSTRRTPLPGRHTGWPIDPDRARPPRSSPTGQLVAAQVLVRVDDRSWSASTRAGDGVRCRWPGSGRCRGLHVARPPPPTRTLVGPVRTRAAQDGHRISSSGTRRP